MALPDLAALRTIIPTWGRPPKSRQTHGALPDTDRRDFPRSGHVGTAMSELLGPPVGWVESMLTLAGRVGPSSPGSTGAAASPAVHPPARLRVSGATGSEPPRRGERPDADIVGMSPPEALAALTRRHADAVYRVALSVTRDHDLAEDVAQDALLKAWQALPTFRGDAPLRNWLLRITHNTAISSLRRRRDVHIDPHDLPEAAELPHHSVEHRVEARVSVDAFSEALDELDELSRAIVVLREVEGLSYDEIAEVLDVPLPTVKTRLLRARRVLAHALEGWRP